MDIARTLGSTAVLVGAPKSLRYNDHQIGQGPALHRLACERGLEGIVSKCIDGRYQTGRRAWLKMKCLNPLGFPIGEVATGLLTMMLSNPGFYSVVAEKNGKSWAATFSTNTVRSPDGPQNDTLRLLAPQPGTSSPSSGAYCWPP
jgi:hypothetical protein